MASSNFACGEAADHTFRLVLSRHVVYNRAKLSTCVTRYLVWIKSTAGPLYVVLIAAFQDMFQQGLLELGGDEGD